MKLRKLPKKSIQTLCFAVRMELNYSDFIQKKYLLEDKEFQTFKCN